MNSLGSMRELLSYLNDEDIALFTTGMISRYAASCNDRKANFYMVGSMGLVSSVGLGMALNTSKRIFIFDGDGSILMDMGTMAMIARYKPQNLFHIIFDNESYESTGGQATISKEIDLYNVAMAIGYSKIFRVSYQRHLGGIIGLALKQNGPVFILLKLKKKCFKDIPRLRQSPEELTKRIQEALS